MRWTMFYRDRMKKARLELGYTQSELGTMAGVDKTSICAYEKGTRTPTLETFVALSHALNLEPNYLLGQDVPIVAEEDDEYRMSMAIDDIKIVEEFKKHVKLYKNLRKDPYRYTKHISNLISRNEDPEE